MPEKPMKEIKKSTSRRASLSDLPQAKPETSIRPTSDIASCAAQTSVPSIYAEWAQD